MSEMTSNAAAPQEAQAVSSMTMIQALRSGLDVMMAKDDNVIVYGEDVGYFGGVFRVTEGLQKKYGKTRCFDAPISEAGIVGTAIGMAAYGLRPAVEIQFADYVYPAYDQIVSELARLRQKVQPAIDKFTKEVGEPVVKEVNAELARLRAPTK
mgnify:CR=1 FL=1